VKVRIPFVERTVKIPTDVTVEVSGKKIRVTGPKGSLEKSFEGSPLVFSLSDGELRIREDNVKKVDVALVGTAHAHVLNMIKGVTQGFTYRLKVVYAHFPMNIRVVNREVRIENFMGERSARVARITGDVTVSVEGDDVLVSGIDKESVSQTAANIQRVTKIRDYDSRVFSDGVFVYVRG